MLPVQGRQSIGNARAEIGNLVLFFTLEWLGLADAAADRLIEGQALALLGLLAVIFVTMSLMSFGFAANTNFSNSGTVWPRTINPRSPPFTAEPGS